MWLFVKRQSSHWVRDENVTQIPICLTSRIRLSVLATLGGEPRGVRRFDRTRLMPAFRLAASHARLLSSEPAPQPCRRPDVPVAHGGIALGLDRLVMILAGESTIREVIPFPKTARATDLMCDAPSPVPERQLRELGIQFRRE